MKTLKIVSLALLSVFAARSGAQPLQVEIHVAPDVSQYLSDWELNPNFVQVFVLNPGPEPVQALLQAELFNGSGALVAHTDPFASQPLLLQPGENILNTAQILPAAAIVISPEFEAILNETGMLPEDNYQLCVTLLGIPDPVPLSEPACAFFFVQGFQQPELLLPPNALEVPFMEHQNLLFQWTPLQPQPAFPFDYVLRIVPVYAGQPPEEAIEQNLPLFEQPLGNTTQVPFPPDLELPPEGGQFAWTVTPLRPDGFPLTPAATPFSFTVVGEVVQPCHCGACLLNGVSIFWEGVQITPSGGVTAGLPLTFVPNFIVDCPAECPLKVEGDWELTFFDAQGVPSEELRFPAVDTLAYTPPQEGRIFLTFVGRAACGDAPCECAPATVQLDVVVHPGDITEPPTDTLPGEPPVVPTDTTQPPVIGVPTDTTQPPVTGVPTDTVPIPGEGIPPHAPSAEECVAFHLLDPATPISPGVALLEPALFKYPRAVPLRAEGIDWDQVTFHCEGCENGSLQVKAVPDRVDRFTWRLEGKGSLDAAFPTPKLDSLQGALKKLLEQLGRLEAEIAELEAEIEERPKELEREKEKARQALQNLNREAARLDSLIAVHTDSLRTLQQQTAEAEATIAALRTQNEQMNADTTRLRRNIESWQDTLAGKPSPEENAKLQAVEQARRTLEDADTAYVRHLRLIQTTARNLEGAIQTAENELETRLQAYNTLKGQVESLTTSVTTLQTQMVRRPGARAFHENQARWNQLAADFVGVWMQGREALANQMLEGQDSVNLRAEAALQAPPARREAARQAFGAKLEAWHTLARLGCSLQNDSTTARLCAQSEEVIHATAEAWKTAVEEAQRLGYRPDPRTREQLEALRRQLQVAEAQMRAAEQNVAQAAQTYDAALEQYASTMSQMQEQKETLAQSAQQARQTLLQLESQYLNLKESRERYLESNRERILRSMYAAIASRDSLARRIALNVDSIGSLRQDIQAWKFAREEVQEELENLQEQKRKIQELIAAQEAILARNLEAELRALRQQLEDLKKEKSDLEKAIERLQKQLQNLLQGKKTASGPIVYYIPPPLEEVMKDKATFDSLKTRLESAESALPVAKEEKAALQPKLARGLERVARHLVAYKFALDDSLALAAEIQELRNQRDLLKNRKSLEYTELQTQLQNQLADTERALEEARNLKQQLLQDSLNLTLQIEQKRQEIEAQKQELQQRLENWKDKKAQRNFEEEQLENIKGTLRKRNDELLRESARLQELEGALAFAEEQKARATAREDQAALAAARAEIESLRAQVNLQRRKVEALRNELESAAGSLQAKQTATLLAIQQWEEAAEQFRQAEETLKRLEKELFELNEAFRQVLAKLRMIRRHIRDLEARKDAINRRREEVRRIIEGDIDSDAEISQLNERIAEKEKALEAARKRMEKQRREAEDLREKLNEERREADRKLKAAYDSLEAARKDLHDFLVREFEKVDFKVKLFLTIDDTPLDGWRSDDAPVKIERELEYPGSRIPRFQNLLARENKPPEPVTNGVCQIQLTFLPPGGPNVQPPALLKKEPRTEALLYRRGRPLWKEWPVLPQDAPLLARDIVPLATTGEDTDLKNHACETNTEDCKPPEELSGALADLGTYEWSAEKGRFLPPRPRHDYALWEPADVAKDKCREEQEVRIRFDANDIAGDPPARNKSKPVVRPAVLIEVPDTLRAPPDTTLKIPARLVRGDHTGLAGEKILFRVKLLAGEAEGYGFGGARQKVETTDGDGYARPEFDFGEGFARFQVDVRWFRGNDTCAAEQVILESPLFLQFLRFNNAPPTFAWDAALQFFQGEPFQNLAAQFPDTKSPQAEEEYEAELHAVAGLLDYERDFVNEDSILFRSLTPDIQIEPEADETQLFGLGRTVVLDPPEPGEGSEAPVIDIRLEAACRDPLRPVCRPPALERAYQSAQLDRFLIGPEGKEFLILLDEPAPSGEAISGTGKIGLQGMEGQVIFLLQNVTLQLEGIVLDEGDPPRAREGKVIWTGDAPIQYNLLSFQLRLDSLVITPEGGAGLGGDVRHPAWENEPLRFYAQLEPNGNFLGSLENLPELSAAGFKLRRGGSIALDLHGNESPDPMEGSFRGVFIPRMELEFPEVFGKGGETQEPTVLTAEDFAVGSGGLQGRLSIEGEGFEVGFGGFAVEVNSLSIAFENGELSEGQIGGSLQLPVPMEGAIEASIGKAGDTWAVECSTGYPVNVPRLGLAFTLQEGTGITWNSATRIATATLHAVVSSEKTGDIVVNGFRVNSKGEVEAEAIHLNRDITFAGFSLHVQTLSFALTATVHEASLEGGFSFSAVGIQDLQGIARISDGPSLSVELQQAEIEFEKGPVHFLGGFAFEEQEFRGQFEVGLLSRARRGGGLSGLFVVGVFPETASQPAFTYWYGELNGRFQPGLALGNSGVSLLGIGGGAGYHYEPPIGDRPGGPKFFDSFPFSFKAAVTLGNTPGGELLAGRLTLALTQDLFALNGKVWLLQKEESLFGEGQLNLRPAEEKLDGYVRMFVGLPDADGGLLRFNGRVNFDVSGSRFRVWSEEISGSVLERLQADAQLDFNNERVHFDGALAYGVKVDVPLAVVTVKVDLGARASGSFDYAFQAAHLSTTLSFQGHWDVDLDTPLGLADITSGSIHLSAAVDASPALVRLDMKGSVHYDVWFYSGSAEVDFGFQFVP